MALSDFPKLASGFYEFVKGKMNWHEPLNSNFEEAANKFKSIDTSLSTITSSNVSLAKSLAELDTQYKDMAQNMPDAVDLSGYVCGLAQNTTVYVSPVGNDSAGDGTAAKPFKTIVRALSACPKYLSNRTYTINVADGTYDESVQFVGFFGGGTLAIKGNETAPQNCKIKTVQAINCFSNISINGVYPYGNTGWNSPCTASHSSNVEIINCYFDEIDNVVGVGILVFSGNVCIQHCHFYNCLICVSALNTADREWTIPRVNVMNCDGSNNQIVLASEGGIVIKNNDIMPSGATMYRKGCGGIIINPNGTLA